MVHAGTAHACPCFCLSVRQSLPVPDLLLPHQEETTLFEVELKEVKAGALRMFLGFWVMGQKGWVGNQVCIRRTCP